MSKELSKRFGGSITLGCDQLLSVPKSSPSNALYFSHGRAAMIWLLLHAGKFDSAAVCAYTWPEIPNMMKRYNCEIGTFDFMQKDIVDLVNKLPGKCLAIVPVFYGYSPWIDYEALALELGDKAFVLLDAAQTAFGFEDYPLPYGGAVLSCPHKSTSLNDGAVLLMDKVSQSQSQEYKKLRFGDKFYLTKQEGRKLLASGDEKKEKKGIKLVTQLEETWNSDPPHRMTAKSYEELLYIDSDFHAFVRIRNYKYLKQKLESYFPQLNEQLNPRVPFAYAVMSDNRKTLLEKLIMKRVFATPLWHNAIHDNEKHPAAADCAKRLIALPIDQRYDIEDMDQLADIVISCL